MSVASLVALGAAELVHWRNRIRSLRVGDSQGRPRLIAQTPVDTA